MLSAVISLLVLGLLVIVHELGHFVVARWSGVRIVRFSIGFGPRLFTWTRGETEYAVSAIPLGGYVKMAGEQHEEQTHQPWEYLSKSIGTRAKIVFAGPCVNYLVALLSLWTVFMIGYPELLPVVGKVVEGMPAHAAGLQAGDRIQAINGQSVHTWDEMAKRIYAAPDQPLTLRVLRQWSPPGKPSRLTGGDIPSDPAHGGGVEGSRVMTIAISPRPKATTDPFGRTKTVGLIGVAPSGEFQSTQMKPFQALQRTIRQQAETTGQTLLSLRLLLTGKLSVQESVTGPIGIVYLTAQAVRMGVAPLLSLVSLFSLSLAIFNFLPIPILDGGHLFFLAMERLRGRPISLNVQERSAQVSLVLLVTLVVVICVNDVSRFGLLEKLIGRR